ncbi:ATP-binding protein [Liquorilactobacillus oeni]|uniref:DNA repair ATPase n=1 Tax=Liquorilactobacillus oeni DSM 19972 TaxID=1423777 RepID=A0A0R1MJS3_9LACO|nr:AAA family ATPase [Liquorilactobacillus oeni]KRL04771.1 DNA repair ATPase [Liquorilactobacillus oeni DSM 19972]
MKILQAEIYGFGKFTDAKFKFNNGLQFITGVNEAGKTTLKAFIVAILFGFADGRQRFKRYQPKEGARYGGRLLVEQDGGLYILERLEGDKGGYLTITDSSSGQKMPAGLLSNWLNAMTSSLFETVYAVDQSNLEKIRSLAPEELEKNFLTIAASGSQQIIELQNKLQKKAEAIYKPNGRIPQLNKLLQNYQKKEKELQDMSSNSHLFVEWEKLIKQETWQRSELGKQVQVCESELLKLQQLQNLWTTFSEFETLNSVSVKEVLTTPIEPERYAYLQEEHLKVAAKKSALQNLSEKISKTTKETDKVVNFAELQLYDEFQEQFANLFKQLNNYLDEIYLALALRKKNAEGKNEQDINSRITQLNGSKTRSKPHSREKVAQKFEDKRKMLAVWGLLVGICLIIVLFAPQNLLKFPAFGGVLFAGYNVWRTFTGVKDLRQEKEELSKEETSSKSFNIGKELEHTNTVKLRLNQLLVELSFFKKSAAFCRERLDLPPDLLDSLEKLLQFKTKITDSLRERNNRNRLLDYYQEEKKKLEEEITVVYTELTAYFKHFGVSSFSQLRERYMRQQQNTEQRTKLKSLQTQISPVLMHELRKYKSRGEITRKLQEKEVEIQQKKAVIATLTEKITEKSVRLEQFGESSAVLELEQELANQQALIIEETDKWLALKTADSCLEKVLELMSQSTLPRVLKLAQQYFSCLTHRRYKKILVEGNRLHLLDDKKIIYDVRELSRATAEQLYLSLRLAFIVLTSRTIKLPILIDDGFVNFDKLRKKEMITLLQKISKETQIICFSVDISFLCDKVDKESILRIN